MAFTLKERQIMGIHGLLPPTVFTQEEQAVRIVNNFRHWQHDLDKYIYLTALQDRNEKLFYKVCWPYLINVRKCDRLIVFLSKGQSYIFSLIIYCKC